jgi:redox-sensing transcriptional repressor
VDIAVITCPKEQVRDIAARLVACKVKGLWNYMGVELGYNPQEIVVENVHLGDSLMILSYKIASSYRNDEDELASSEDSITDLPDEH